MSFSDQFWVMSELAYFTIHPYEIYIMSNQNSTVTNQNLFLILHPAYRFIQKGQRAEPPRRRHMARNPLQLNYLPLFKTSVLMTVSPMSGWAWLGVWFHQHCIQRLLCDLLYHNYTSYTCTCTSQFFILRYSKATFVVHTKLL